MVDRLEAPTGVCSHRMLVALLYTRGSKDKVEEGLRREKPQAI